MKVLFILVAVILSFRFVSNAMLMTTTKKDNWRWVVRTTFDAFLIIAFAILEKGRW